MLGIIGAMPEEVAELIEGMKEERTETKAGMLFHAGTLDGEPAVIVKSGVGKVNAGICAQILVDDFHVTGLINTGIAGSLDASIDIGDIVVSSDALYYDVEATVWGYRPGEIPQLGTREFTADKEMVRRAKQACRTAVPDIGVHSGRIASGDSFISDRVKKEWIRETFGASCAEMEGAAIAQTAWLNGVPFVILRAISDKADGSATMDYDVFEKKAIDHLVRSVREFCRTR
ncbi:MAG: 5'-methylthioadenosine/adenosylhomocysteine nucleosidase [Lachnospiraceae bacterium]|nr:5'-methylthioadenosine/adenosylhomocysteine nucleosidase [Lachnospiraceae bacterium]